MGALSYLLYGAALVVVFAVIVVYYFGSKRQQRIEQAKFRMLDDED